MDDRPHTCVTRVRRTFNARSGGRVFEAYLTVEALVGFDPLRRIEGNALGIDGVHGEPQLTRQHRQRVAINARDDAASQVPHRYHTRPLAAQQIGLAKTSILEPVRMVIMVGAHVVTPTQRQHADNAHASD